VAARSRTTSTGTTLRLVVLNGQRLDLDESDDTRVADFARFERLRSNGGSDAASSWQVH
jgi:hypothetical protein